MESVLTLNEVLARTPSLPPAVSVGCACLSPRGTGHDLTVFASFSSDVWLTQAKEVLNLESLRNGCLKLGIELRILFLHLPLSCRRTKLPV